MCRLFAQISVEPQQATAPLVQSEFSLLKQSNLKSDRLQKDGWGIGSFENSKAIVVKSARPAYEEPQKMKSAAEKAISKTIIGHIRAATNPKGLDQRRLLTTDNSQPFENGEWIFAHNGTIEIPDEISERLGPLKKRVATLSDSEVYFWQFIKFVNETGNPVRAFERCTEELWAAWKECREKYPQKKAPYTSLNAVAIKENALHAYCHSIFTPNPNESLISPHQPWYTLTFTERNETLIVASEKLDAGSWNILNSSEILSAEISKKKINISINNYLLQSGKLKKSEENNKEVSRRNQ